MILTKPGLLDVPETGTPTPLPPKARLLSELVRPSSENDPDELLRHRFLCRKGTLLLCGPTGVGKSSFSMQCMIQWALGRSCLGIEPASPLKSLLIQAENDDGDLAEMRDGVFTGLGLSQEERETAGQRIVVVREDSRSGMEFWLSVVAPLLAEHRPDLLCIDPVLAFLGGEANSQKDVGGFLRNNLNPLLREFNCGCVIVHHTNKPPSGKEKSTWTAGDFAYLGSGSAEWANHARAVLAIRSVGSHQVFELQAGKRGSRLGWKEADGQTNAFVKCLGHSKQPGAVYWQEIEANELQASQPKRGHTKEDLLPLIPPAKPIAKNVLIENAKKAGIGDKAARAYLTELLANESLHEWKRKRSGTNPELFIARSSQPEGEFDLK